VITERAPQALPPALAELFTRAPNGQLVLNMQAVASTLGFDPRTADMRQLTPEQRQAWRQLQAAADSIRKVYPAGGQRRP
jgi:hypothetical protein